MRRINEIIAEIRTKHPDDSFFSEFESSCQLEPIKRKYYRAYNNALMTLNDRSWKVLKKKAIQHYLDHRPGQKKQGFFNQLNEAFANQYLVSKGFENVEFLKEENGKRPDIGFKDQEVQRYCEIKTLCISEVEISKRKAQSVYDGSVYAHLSDGFFNQFKSNIAEAWDQIHSVGESGLVFIIINFDDIALDHYKAYRRQLIEFCNNEALNNLFIKIGILGNRRICITSH